MSLNDVDGKHPAAVAMAVAKGDDRTDATTRATLCPSIPWWQFWRQQHAWERTGPQQGTIYTYLWIPMRCVRCGLKGQKVICDR